MSRLGFNIILLMSLFLLNWWLLLVLFIVAVFVFNKFYEGLFYALIFDFIYGAESVDKIYLKFMTTVIFALLLFVVERLKNYLTFYPRKI